MAVVVVRTMLPWGPSRASISLSLHISSHVHLYAHGLQLRSPTTTPKVQMRQMGEGTFIGKNKPDPEYTAIATSQSLQLHDLGAQK